MRSLDKVIEKIESAWVCPSSDEAAEFCELIEIREEALHYLKELKEVRGTLATARVEAKKEIENFKQKILEEIAYNPALSWEELLMLEGKPVWVERCNGDTKGWLLILRTNYDVITCTTKHGNSFYLYKNHYCEKWQAYRKERKDDTG